MENILYKPNEALGIKKYQNGLSLYTQTNCNVNLTDEGYHIYRPPNLSSSDKTYGGLKIYNQNSDSIRVQNNGDNIFGLIEGHTYIIRWHVSGQSSNVFYYIQWQNNMGNNGKGKGLMPAPTNVIKGNIPSNFNGEQECFYKFTPDSIFKTCSDGTSPYMTGQTYLSYRHFSISFNYANTGALGTDLYITNLRMYDITDNEKNYSITKEGIILPAQVIEMPINQASIQNSGDLICNNFYEY